VFSNTIQNFVFRTKNSQPVGYQRNIDFPREFVIRLSLLSG